MKNEEEGGDSIEVAKEEMILEDDTNDDGIVEAIAEAAQEAELEHMAEVTEENEGALSNISMSSNTSQESVTELAADTQTEKCAKLCKYTLKCFGITRISKFKNLCPKVCKNVSDLLQV